jgi:hypothetical protein
MNASRDNSHDPLSPEYTAVVGNVKSRAHYPIVGARMTVLPENQSALTDSSGSCTISGLDEGTHIVVAEASSHASDSQQVEVVSGRAVYPGFELNGLPYFEYVRVVSGHEPLWPLEISYANLTASPNDPDGIPDIESLHVEIEEMGHSGTLRFDHELGCFCYTITPESLPGGNLDIIFGKEMKFIVTDKLGARGEATSRLVRVVSPLPTIVSPRDGKEVGPTPTLVWESSAPYAVTYSVAVHGIESPGLVWALDSIPQSVQQIQISDSLAQGHYVWTLTVFDEFGNWAISDRAGFGVVTQ